MVYAGFVRVISLRQPSLPLPSPVWALNSDLLGLDQTGRDAGKQQPAEEDYQIRLV